MQAELLYDLQLILITDMLRYQIFNINYFYFFKDFFLTLTTFIFLKIFGWLVTGMDSNVNVVLISLLCYIIISCQCVGSHFY